MESIEQSFHALVSEVARGFVQRRQQLTRVERRIDAVDARVAALRTALLDGTARIIAAMKPEV